MHLLHTKMYNHLPPYYLLQLHFCKVYHYPYILLRPIEWSLFYILIIFYFLRIIRIFPPEYVNI